MEQKIELKFHYVLALSLFLHILAGSFMALPFVFDPEKASKFYESIHNESLKNTVIRDVIVNINQDDQEVVTRQTRLSDRSSTAKGHLSEKKGDTWLNNSRDFKASEQSVQTEKTTPQSQKIQKMLISENDVSYSITFYEEKEFIDQNNDQQKSQKEQVNDAKQIKEAQKFNGKSVWGKIPDSKGVNLANAIYYSNSRQFSFNTQKFSNFNYFKNMKDKIAENWNPPIAANTLSNGYIPGRVRIRTIGSQEIKLYFTMDRSGEVQKVVILDSMGNEYLDQSCIDAIEDSKNFGPVPKEIDGEEIVIPFIFGFYVR